MILARKATDGCLEGWSRGDILLHFRPAGRVLKTGDPTMIRIPFNNKNRQVKISSILGVPRNSVETS